MRYDAAWVIEIFGILQIRKTRYTFSLWLYFTNSHRLLLNISVTATLLAAVTLDVGL